MTSYFYCLKNGKVSFTKCKTSKLLKNCQLFLKDVPRFEEYNGVRVNFGINFIFSKEPFVVLTNNDPMYAKKLLLNYIQDRINDKILETDDLYRDRYIITSCNYNF